MRFILAIALGAAILVIPGIAAFVTWEDADSKPTRFDVYCDWNNWRGEVSCPSGKTYMLAGLGALAGLAGATVAKYPRSRTGTDSAPHGSAGTRT